LHTRFGQRFFRGRNGAGSHDAWIYAAGGIGNTIRARDVMPRLSAFSLVMTTRQAAPSLIPLALPAVTVPSFLKGGRYLGHAFDSGAEPGMFVRIKGNGVFFPLGNDHGDDFFGKPAFLDGGLGLVLAGHGKGILFLAGDAEFFGHVFGGDAHVVPVEDVEEAVEHHAVDHFGVAHTGAPPSLGDVKRGDGHIFDATGQHDIGIVRIDGLGGHGHGFKARGANLVDGCGHDL
jgi:hypothetical protein